MSAAGETKTEDVTLSDGTVVKIITRNFNILHVSRGTCGILEPYVVGAVRAWNPEVGEVVIPMYAPKDDSLVKHGA